MRKIAFHLNDLSQGGAQRAVTTLANALVAEGYEVLIATEWYEEDGFALDPRVLRVHVGLREEDARKGRVQKFLLRVRYLRAFLREYQPDVLIPFAQRAIYRALMASRGLRLDYGTSRHEVPVIVCCRTNPVGFYDHISDKLQIRWLFPRAAGAVFQTAGQREFFRPWLQENSAIILNPVNDKYIGVEAPPARDKAVVHHARLDFNKNQPLLCRAFLQVHAAHPDYVLRIYGPDAADGTSDQLREIIKSNHAEDYILLMGPSSTLEQQLPHGAVYALTSDCEGLPNSLLEAMALGLPCVSTDCPCGGPREVIENGVSGLLVPVGDEDAVAAAINRLIEDPALAERLGCNARRTIAERCNTAAICAQWREYIETVIRRAEGR